MNTEQINQNIHETKLPTESKNGNVSCPTTHMESMSEMSALQEQDKINTERRIKEILNQIQETKGEEPSEVVDTLIQLYKKTEKIAEDIRNRDVSGINFDLEINSDKNKASTILIRNKDGREIDLNSYLPNGIPFKLSDYYCRFVHKGKKEIEFTEINNPSAFLLMLFHELGHAHNIMNNGEKVRPSVSLNIKARLGAIYNHFERKISQKQIGPETTRFIGLGDLYHYLPKWFIEHEKELRSQSERNAWAYALRELRKLERQGFDVFAGFKDEDELKFYIEHNLISYERQRAQDLSNNDEGYEHIKAGNFQPKFIKNLKLKKE